MVAPHPHGGRTVKTINAALVEHAKALEKFADAAGFDCVPALELSGNALLTILSESCKHPRGVLAAGQAAETQGDAELFAAVSMLRFAGLVTAFATVAVRTAENILRSRGVEVRHA